MDHAVMLDYLHMQRRRGAVHRWLVTVTLTALLLLLRWA